MAPVGVRMSIANLWDHRAVLYRPGAAGTDANGDPTTGGFSAPTTPTGLNARPDQSWAGLLADTPLGEVQAATRIWFLDRDFTDVRERDVIDVVTGPIAPIRFRVLSVSKPTNPSTVHHVEVASEVYHGGIT